VRLRTDEGTELDAEYSVTPDGEYLGVVLESAGGQTAAGGRGRNHEYAPALLLLLERLKSRHAVLHTALVASARVADLPEAERRLVEEPVALDDVTNLDQLRRDLTRAQRRVVPGTATRVGNNRKRIMLRLEVPGYGPEDAAHLEVDLSVPVAPVELPTAYELLTSLLHKEVHTSRGRRNTVLDLDGDTVLVGTERSPDGQPVEVRHVQQALDILAVHGSVVVQPHELGHRSSFVGAVLANLPNAFVTGDPPTVTLGVPSVSKIAEDPRFGELDGQAQVKVRKEQSQLRGLLAGGRKSAPCALCGHPYPMAFLVAAHVKKRSECTRDERLDLHNVAMLACLFGCDALYEAGWITVGEDGRIRARDATGELADRLASLDGRLCAAHGPGSEPYFAWHRAQWSTY
jgi:hypothetical protein